MVFVSERKAESEKEVCIVESQRKADRKEAVALLLTERREVVVSVLPDWLHAERSELD